MRNDFSTYLLIYTLLMSVFAVVKVDKVQKRLASLARVEAKLDALLEHAGLKFDPYARVPSAVAEALSRGEKMQAIKAYRKATGAGLKAAKDYVEEIQRLAAQSG